VTKCIWLKYMFFCSDVIFLQIQTYTMLLSSTFVLRSLLGLNPRKVKFPSFFFTFLQFFGNIQHGLSEARICCHYRKLEIRGRRTHTFCPSSSPTFRHRLDRLQHLKKPWDGYIPEMETQIRNSHSASCLLVT
jgi:hypothetical protein